MQLTEELPGSPEIRYWLYSALAALDMHEEADRAFRQAIALHAMHTMQESDVEMDRYLNDAEYAEMVGQSYYSIRCPAIAAVAYERAVQLKGPTTDLIKFYALALHHQGRSEEASAVFRGAAEAYKSTVFNQFLLFTLFFTKGGVAGYSEEAKRWAATYTPAHPDVLSIPTNPAGRKLKIGYLAPSFSRSQIAQFIGPVLAAHDPEAVEVILYTEALENEDPLPCDRIVEIGELSDQDAVDLIRADQLDILADVWGHTAGSRIHIFAQRAAPVQVAWINFVQTTGLSTMDYVLHSDSMDAPGTDALFTETIWRMGDITIPYRPADNRPPPSPTPALANGYVTFGSFNNPTKLSPQTVAAWSRILLGRPNSRLLLKYAVFADPVLRRMVQARFAVHGVDPARVLFEGHSKDQDYLAAFGRLDLALDPSPCPGGTTSCDAIANGVPVLTLAGPDFYSRIGIQAVAVSGMPDLVAESWDDYVAKALAVTADLDTLTALRARVLPGFEASALRDEVGFTRRLEGVFRQMANRQYASRA
jgi:predicted O-linked N-acetylglucosamine transferase (SPINDLY family)